MDIGTYLAKARRTQTEFAEKVGVTRSAISQIVNGDTSPSGPLAARIIRESGGLVTLDDLFPPQPEEGAEPSKEAA